VVAGRSFRLDFRLAGWGEVVDLDDSSDGRDDGPGCDMAGRLRAPRRGAATGPVDGAVWDAAVRGRLVFRLGDVGAGCIGASACRSWREDALRFRDGVEPVVCSGVPDSAGGGSVASLAEERVILREEEAEVPAGAG
jgi:hypothetical protein